MLRIIIFNIFTSEKTPKVSTLTLSSNFIKSLPSPSENSPESLSPMERFPESRQGKFRERQLQPHLFCTVADHLQTSILNTLNATLGVCIADDAPDPINGNDLKYVKHQRTFLLCNQFERCATHKHEME